MTGNEQPLIPAERVERAIRLIRGERVIMDADLARLYGVPTKVLVQAVKRNLNRFPLISCSNRAAKNSIL